MEALLVSWGRNCFGAESRRGASVLAVGVVPAGVGYIGPNATFL
ncbi:MAG: hypothetical protein AAGC80_31940 [Rhodococcus sp. (in: high G+C Gram-positive bacteria)]